MLTKNKFHSIKVIKYEIRMCIKKMTFRINKLRIKFSQNDY